MKLTEGTRDVLGFLRMLRTPRLAMPLLLNDTFFLHSCDTEFFVWLRLSGHVTTLISRSTEGYMLNDYVATDLRIAIGYYL